MNQQLEESDSHLKKTETELLNTQRRIRELDRQITLQKDNDKQVLLTPSECYLITSFPHYDNPESSL